MPLKHNLMTTLHGLVTISELFAGFNLINRGVVNCLIILQNARKMHHSETKSKKVLGRGHSPLPRPLSHWGGDNPSDELTHVPLAIAILVLIHVHSTLSHQQRFHDVSG